MNSIDDFDNRFDQEERLTTVLTALIVLPIEELKIDHTTVLQKPELLPNP